MARIGRWMGAIIVEVNGVQAMVGNPKEPCSFTPPVPLSSPLTVEDRPLEELAAIVRARLVITRNDSVSERLWRLITCDKLTQVDWLIETPAPVWEIVRDSVLRCS